MQYRPALATLLFPSFETPAQLIVASYVAGAQKLWRGIAIVSFFWTCTTACLEPSFCSSYLTGAPAQKQVLKCGPCNPLNFRYGRLAERLKAPVLKTGRGASSS